MDIGRPVDEVQAVMTFYYKNVRQQLSALDTVNLQLENIGTFYVKEKALIKTITSYDKYFNTLSDLKIKEYESKITVKKKIDVMVNMKSLIDDEKLRRKAVINKRFNNELKEKYNPDLEE